MSKCAHCVCTGVADVVLGSLAVIATGGDIVSVQACRLWLTVLLAVLRIEATQARQPWLTVSLAVQHRESCGGY